MRRARQHTNFYPRPPRGGRRAKPQRSVNYENISIHALREEGDLGFFGVCAADNDFYPRPPRGGRPSSERNLRAGCGISIHALREEGDSVPASTSALNLSYFYPRPPRGGRRYVVASPEIRRHFYPRPPRGGRPHVQRQLERADWISIHALREEGDYY